MNEEWFLDELLDIEALEEHRIKHWEHYRRFFMETKQFYYYVNSRGYLEKYPKSKYTEEGPLNWEFIKIKPLLYKRNKKNKREEYLAVIVNHKRYPIKMLVAKTFSRIWKPGSRIMHLDGNIHHCSFTNLQIVPPGSQMKTTHRGKQIEILHDGRWYKFDSLKEAAETFNLSLSSFRRYIQGGENIQRRNGKRIIRFRFI